MDVHILFHGFEKGLAFIVKNIDQLALVIQTVPDLDLELVIAVLEQGVKGMLRWIVLHGMHNGIEFTDKYIGICFNFSHGRHFSGGCLTKKTK